jgi:anti-sigma regulatory factor (Ser/Thr protein kinase)
MRLDRDPDSARHARQAVEDCLDVDTPTETMRNAVLLTSELVTNAMTHTVSAGELIAYYNQLRKRLRIEVRDNSPVLPRMQDDSAERVGGLGLRLLDTLASDWGTTATATGKTVWFELKW